MLGITSTQALQIFHMEVIQDQYAKKTLNIFWLISLGSGLQAVPEINTSRI